AYPGAEWVEGDMRALALGRRFDAVVAWNSLFHLPPADQRAVFPVFAPHAPPGAALRVTSGPAAGEAIGTWGGEPLYHASLDPAEYRALLGAHGFRVLAHVARDPACGDTTVWLAQRAVA
ncbi:class I SAM-dependent methyltransferase, partial [Xanthomonas citri pv. citri]